MQRGLKILLAVFFLSFIAIFLPVTVFAQIEIIGSPPGFDPGQQSPISDCGGPDCGPIEICRYPDPACLGSDICTGCKTVVAGFDTVTQTTNYYCWDDSSKCVAGQICSGGACIAPTPAGPVCGDGICSPPTESPATCPADCPAPTPICPGCQTWNGVSCVDDNTKCPEGVCVNGTCSPVPPPPTPVPTPNGLGTCGAVCSGDAQCDAGLGYSCYLSVCRKTACLTEVTCVCPTPPPPTPVPTAVPTPSLPATVGGAIQTDSQNNYCVSGSSPASGIQVSILNMNPPNNTYSTQTDRNGNYTFR